MAGPLVLLYIISIYVVRMVNPYRRDDEDDNSATPPKELTK